MAGRSTRGRDTLLLAPTNAIVDELNVRARSARLAALAQADPQWRPGRDTLLSDQLAASAGDIIRTRDNARWLRLSATDYVRNGYTYEVLEVGVEGSLRVRHIGTDREITLPADYVTSEVTLGYATTIDGAQGLTAGYSCHVVGAEHITRQLLYVALTRGRVEITSICRRQKTIRTASWPRKPPTPTPRWMCCRRFWPATERRCRQPPPNAKPQIRCCGSLQPPTCTTTHWALLTMTPRSGRSTASANTSLSSAMVGVMT